MTRLNVALTSMSCLIIAMGMGRFALTPQLPHMLNEGQIDLTQASLLAAANFLGYLIGAWETTYARHHHLIYRLRAGLWGTALILLFSALIPNNAWGLLLNLTLRFAAGIASAWVFVLLSTWHQKELSHNNRLRTLAFSGPGLGIILTGIIAFILDVGGTDANFNWFIFGVVSLIGCGLLSNFIPKTLPEAPKNQKFQIDKQGWRLLISYSLCGVGYVLPATFLSKLAADEFPGSLAADAFWPLFGVAVILGMAVLAAQKHIRRPQLWLAMTYIMQGLGVFACTFMHGVWGLVIGATFVGGAFLAILQLTMRIGSELTPTHLRAMTGLLTTSFAVGQLIGPILSAISSHTFSSITPALILAGLGSFLAAWLVYCIKT